MTLPVVSVSIDDDGYSEALQKIADRISGRFRKANDEYSNLVVDEIQAWDAQKFKAQQVSKGVEMEVEEVFIVDGVLYRKLAGDEILREGDKYREDSLFKKTNHLGARADCILPDNNTFYAREVVISSSDYRELDVGEDKHPDDQYNWGEIWSKPDVAMLGKKIVGSTAVYRRKFKVNNSPEKKSIKNHIEEAVDNIVNAEPYTMVMCGCKMHSFKSTDDPYKEHRNFQSRSLIASEGSVLNSGIVEYETGIGISANKRTVRMDDQYEV